MLPVALMDERVMECIRPVSRELLRDAAAELKHVQLCLHVGPAGHETDLRLEVRVVEPAGAPAPQVTQELTEAARQLADAWFAVGQGLPSLLYTCERGDDGAWSTKLTLAELDSPPEPEAQSEGEAEAG